MRRPRISISGIMAVVLILATDIALIREVVRWNAPCAVLALTLIPSGSLLVLVLARIVLELRRSRESPAFLFGYFTAGVLAAIAAGCYCAG